ncbi:MAG: tyrosine-type recombinase/integrase [Betaproteobacteria bacterium]
MGDYFDDSINNLSPAQLTDYFSDPISTYAWSAVQFDLYGFKFYTGHVLSKPWAMPNFIKPPKVQRLPDIVTAEEAQALFCATRRLSYRVFYFTAYRMCQRLSEGLALKVGDSHAVRHRVHVRDSKGNRDRSIPLPATTHPGKPKALLQCRRTLFVRHQCVAALREPGTRPL